MFLKRILAACWRRAFKTKSGSMEIKAVTGPDDSGGG